MGKSGRKHRRRQAIESSAARDKRTFNEARSGRLSKPNMEGEVVIIEESPTLVDEAKLPGDVVEEDREKHKDDIEKMLFVPNEHGMLTMDEINANLRIIDSDIRETKERIVNIKNRWQSRRVTSEGSVSVSSKYEGSIQTTPGFPQKER